MPPPASPIPTTEYTPTRPRVQALTLPQADATLIPLPHPDPLPPSLPRLEPAATRHCFEALYLHIPFCFHKCHYCDFYSVVNSDARDPDRQAAFTDALLRELDHWAGGSVGMPLRPRTIFVGGGTPTLLRPEHWRRLLEAMRRWGVLTGVEEFTVEANPETVTPDLLRLLVEGGVDRISIGAQSFEHATLKALERWHDPDSVGRAVDMARVAGIARINLDLIFAAPGQTLAGWERDLERALALEPTHLSCYGLTYEPGTVLGKRRDLGRVTPTEEAVERAMYEHALDRLPAAGFYQYEVSAWARQRGGVGDERCKHNLAYWRCGDYLGLGPSAASHFAGRRWKNLPHIGRYAADSPRPPLLEDEALTPRERVEERLMFGLRLNAGINTAWLEGEAVAQVATLPADLADLLAWGLVTRDAQSTRLTRAGLLVADSVLARLI